MSPEPTCAAPLLDDPLEQQRSTRFVVDAQGQRWAETALHITGMHCAACAGTVEAALGAQAGVRGVQVSAAAQRALLRWDPQATRLSTLVHRLAQAGYGAIPDNASDAHALRRAEARQALWRLFVAGFCAMQVMMLATPAYVADPGDLAQDMRQLLNWGSWLLTLPVLVFSAQPFWTGAWAALRERRMAMDLPVALGLAVSFVASSGAAFQPGGLFGDEVYFDSLTMFVSFLLAARWWETRARHAAVQALEQATLAQPEAAWRVAADGSVRLVSALRLAVGDVLRVPVGQAFAADAVLLSGPTQAREALLTGESHPVPKAVGDEVVAGSLNLGAPVQVRVLRVGGDTRLAAMVALMREAATQRPALVRLADRWAGPFLWTVLLLAALSAAVWSVLDPARAVWVAVAVLIVTCPCALSLAAPSALLAASGALARRGVLVKRLDALQRLAEVDTVVFDKTGTLTDDGQSMTQLVVLQGHPHSEPSLRRHAASLASWSAHPLARAVAAMEQQAALAWQAVSEQPGAGLQGSDEQGRQWRLGSASFVGATPSLDGAEEASAWLACDGRVCARLDIGETLREGARQAVAALQAAGLRVVLMSGDQARRAHAVGAELGVDEVVAPATPQRKLAWLAERQAAGHAVAMVGDGLNDAPVLARADVSLAMGQGALQARSQADAVLMASRPLDVVQARALAVRMLRVVRQNLAWAAAYNAICVPLALVGWLPPWAAGLGMAASSVLVVSNALRLAR